MEGLGLTCTHSNICLGTWYVSEIQIKKVSSSRELDLRVGEISHLPILCASATTMGAPGGWTSPSLMARSLSMVRDGFETYLQCIIVRVRKI